MSALKQLRERIQSVKSTQKITMAMKLVSSAKLHRAQDILNHQQRYHQAFAQTWHGAIHGAYMDDVPPMLRQKEGAGKLLIVFMSDRGLCGSYNSSVVRYLEPYIMEQGSHHGGIQILPIGLKAVDMLQFKHKRRFANLLFPSREHKPSMQEVIATTVRFLLKNLKDHAYSSVDICYTRFHSMLNQDIAHTELLLPAHPPLTEGFAPLFEPQRPELLASLAPLYIENAILHAYCHAQASEQAMRMRAMDTATNNAKDMLTRLSRTYNRTRQANITGELIEIVSGANAL